MFGNKTVPYPYFLLKIMNARGSVKANFVKKNSSKEIIESF